MTRPDWDFTGKIVAVTGATRGLGRQIVQGFADRGASVVVVSRKASDCEATTAELTAAGATAVAIPCDVSQWAAGEELVKGIAARFGRLDVLVNNAGMSPVLRRLTDLDEAGYDAIFNTNVKSVFRLSTLAAELMKTNGGGAIVNISSTAAVLAPAAVAPYAGAKAAVEALTRGLARSYGPKVRVNAIQCGTFRTDLTAGFVDLPAFQQQVQMTNPARRIGDPTEVVGAALYLASDLASYTSGAVLKVDGGEA
ncbi:MAG: glucose 1-dehydrogenase [Alphaproteobacteria bacterium]|nr:glucose 1-dehydrogenase [Alphaproteobacteria bacterium]MBU1516383.1 glucose 1-dehydrogenase [Alphaproteobacteria bacterium]MBU2093380.1 glucose 1-dehydrogenase [Alphaproteobacteria bacterium]MBU2153867.1 glucose 1-dehydrogenase [Alphaproteobacteria bacterium]MBU2307739.1 glucose 1-dehydrogenase [Alphaproteobacteria bacterium]